MAFITLSGTLLDPNGDLAVGDQIRFTHKSTTGETVQSAVSLITVNPAGTYSLPLQYGLVLVEYRDVRTQQFKNLGVATVNQDNPATSIPELLNALVPVSSAELIEFQAILADCVTAQTAAENAATTAEAFAYQLTTTDLIASTATFAAATNIPTSGFTTSGDGGNGSWKQNGVTGQVPSQSPAQLGDALLNDGNGNQWALVSPVNLIVESLGDDSSALAAAIAASGKITGKKSTVTSTASLTPSSTTFNDLNYEVNITALSTLVSFTPLTNGMSLDGMLLDGSTTESGGVRNHTAHMIGISSFDLSGVNILNSEITGFSFPILKTNATTGNQDRFNVSNNYFHGNYGVDALFNSPAAASSMKDITVIGNSFGDNLAGDIGGFSHRVSMAGHVENFRVIGNNASGTGNEIWRAEEAAKIGVVIGNTAKLGDRHGIEVTDNNAGGTAYTPSLLDISDNVLSGTKTAGTRGLHFVHDGSTLHPIERSIVSNNILDSWESGIRTGLNTSWNYFSNNIVNNCDQAVLAQEPSLMIDNTMAIDCPIIFNAGSGGLFGHVDLRDTTTETPLFGTIATVAGNPIAVTGWSWESQRFTVPSVADTYIPFIELGDDFNLDVVIYFGREAGNYTMLRCNLDWDGATLVTTELRRSQSGSLILSGSTPFRANAGNLEFHIFAGSVASYTNCRAQIKATGMHVFS